MISCEGIATRDLGMIGCDRVATYRTRKKTGREKIRQYRTKKTKQYRKRKDKKEKK